MTSMGMVPERRRMDSPTGEGERVAAAEHAGEEEAGGEAQAGSAGDEDAGELKCSVSGDEAPEAEGHVVLRAGGSDDAEVDAVGEHEERGFRGRRRFLLRRCRSRRRCCWS